MTTSNEAFQPEVVATKSWVAYFKALIPAAALLLIGTALLNSVPTAGWIFIVCALAFAAYRIIDLRSARVFVNLDGVFYESGVFPWNKGFVGARWDELDNAFFMKGLIPWIARSYNIVATHKFSRTNVFVATDMRRGAEAVSLINDLKAEYLSAQRDAR